MLSSLRVWIDRIIINFSVAFVTVGHKLCQDKNTGEQSRFEKLVMNTEEQSRKLMVQERQKQAHINDDMLSRGVESVGTLTEHITEKARELLTQQRQHEDHVHDNMLNRAVEEGKSLTENMAEKARELLTQERQHEDHVHDNMLNRAAETLS